MRIEQRDRAAARTILTDDQVEALRLSLAQRTTHERQTAQRGLLLPRQDAHVARAEQQIGRLLLGALIHDAAFAAALSRVLEAARAPDQPTAIAVECADPRLRDLPWELLTRAADALPIEAVGSGFVARLEPGAGRPRAAARRAITNVAVFDAGADRTVMRVVDALDAGLAAAGLPPRGTDAAGDLRIVHLIAHGELEADLLRLRNGAGTSAVAARMQHLLPDADLVIASVCHAAEQLPTEAEELPAVVLEAGALACVAAAGPVRDEAMAAFYAGFFEAVAAQADLAAAVVAGRSAVRRLALPHPDSRWHLLRLSVCDLGWLAEAPRLAPAWRPAGWPTPGPSAARLLQTARAFAEGWQHGYVGIEHLLLAIEATAESGVPHRLAHLCVGASAALGPLLQGLTAQVETPTWRATPRLRAWADALPSGFEAGDLGALILRDADAALTHLLGADAAHHPTLGEQTEGAPEAARPAAGLICLGGPDDGRHLALSADATIGRASRSSPADVALYADTAVTDTRCSRAHLRWLGAGRIERLRPANGARGPLHLGVGEVVHFGRATRLLGSSRATSPGDPV